VKTTTKTLWKAIDQHFEWLEAAQLAAHLRRQTTAHRAYAAAATALSEALIDHAAYARLDTLADQARKTVSRLAPAPRARLLASARARLAPQHAP
jgi:putative protein kinase ArgK-like GTPase of G3E family